MDCGFESLKDVIDVLIIPIAIFTIGVMIPSLFDAVKSRKFVALIKRELKEMEPWPKETIESNKWYQHLKKRFVHEEIFENVSENRDFILSLPPDITYNAKQLWTHYHKATNVQSSDELAEEGASWCDSLRELCAFLDRGGKENFTESIYKPWECLVLEYHPGLRAARRLPPRQQQMDE
jgi:hypothetical protein